MESLRICFCHHLRLDYGGGGERWICDLSRELRKRGHEVEIRTLPFGLDERRVKVPDDIEYFEALHHQVKDADVAYVTYNPLSWMNFSVQSGIPKIAGFHSHTYWMNPHPRYGLLPNLSNIINRIVGYFELRQFNAVHILSNVFQVNHPKIFVIPNFVDEEHFKPCSKNGEFKAIFPGRLDWQKGWDIFRDMTKSLHGECAILGGGLSYEELPQAYGRAHVSVIPSRVDTFGLSIIESNLCGTPVVTSALVSHIGLRLPLYFANTVGDYVEKVLHLRRRWVKGEYSTLAEVCRHNALQFGKKAVVDRIESMFKEVAS